MADIYSSKLHVWDGWRSDLAPAAGADSAPSPAPAADGQGPLDWLFRQETFVSRARRGREPEPLSLAWFLEIEGLRYGRHGKWVPRLLEFGKHAGERLLGIGPGLGTDWVQYARHGAEVVVCSPVGAQLELVQRNFALRGLRARFLHADPTVLPIETASMDVVCLGSLLDELPAPAAVVQEVFRVLKPGGKVLALAPALRNADFWCNRWLPWRRRRSARTPAHGLTGRAFRRLFDCFVEPRVSKRQLRRSDVPHLLRWFPPSALERVMGRLLILKAFKPLSVAVPALAAA